MLKEILKEYYKDSWMADCVSYLDDSFFEADVIPKIAPVKLMKQIMNEKNFRRERMKMVCTNDSEKIWKEVSLETSENYERKLIDRWSREYSDKIEKARAYPIEELIEFKHGFAKCLWHNEKTPSLHWNKNNNTAHCFGCNKTYDSIDAYKAIHNCSFAEAIKDLG